MGAKFGQWKHMSECEKSEYMKDERNDAEMQEGMNKKWEIDFNEDPRKRCEKWEGSWTGQRRLGRSPSSRSQKRLQLLGELRLVRLLSDLQSGSLPTNPASPDRTRCSPAGLQARTCAVSGTLTAHHHLFQLNYSGSFGIHKYT